MHASYSTDQQIADCRLPAGWTPSRGILDRPVRTIGRNGVLHVELTDWGTNALEQQLSDTRARNAIDKPFKLHTRP